MEEEKDNLSDEQPKELEYIATKSFGASNAIPIGYYDAYNNLIYIASIGDRKIRSFEFTQLSKDGIKEMNASFRSKEDIQGISFITKQQVDIKKVEMTKCYKMSKDGIISPISFFIPRKRTEYFQDDLYSDILDLQNKPLNIDICSEEQNKLNIDITYISTKPDEMELLSQAPQEKESAYQKRRNSQIKQMDAEKLKEQPKSTEQAFDQFS